jgi:hypothetical protein
MRKQIKINKRTVSDEIVSFEIETPYYFKDTCVYGRINDDLSALVLLEFDYGDSKEIIVREYNFAHEIERPDYFEDEKLFSNAEEFNQIVEKAKQFLL